MIQPFSSGDTCQISMIYLLGHAYRLGSLCHANSVGLAIAARAMRGLWRLLRASDPP